MRTQQERWESFDEWKIGECLYKCEICDTIFPESGVFTQHLREQHNVPNNSKFMSFKAYKKVELKCELCDKPMSFDFGRMTEHLKGDFEGLFTLEEYYETYWHPCELDPADMEDLERQACLKMKELCGELVGDEVENRGEVTEVGVVGVEVKEKEEEEEEKRRRGKRRRRRPLRFQSKIAWVWVSQQAVLCTYSLFLHFKALFFVYLDGK